MEVDPVIAEIAGRFATSNISISEKKLELFPTKEIVEHQLCVDSSLDSTLLHHPRSYPIVLVDVKIVNIRPSPEHCLRRWWIPLCYFRTNTAYEHAWICLLSRHYYLCWLRRKDAADFPNVAQRRHIKGGFYDPPRMKPVSTESADEVGQFAEAAIRGGPAAEFINERSSAIITYHNELGIVRLRRDPLVQIVDQQ